MCFVAAFDDVSLHAGLEPPNETAYTPEALFHTKETLGTSSLTSAYAFP